MRKLLSVLTIRVTARTITNATGREEIELLNTV